MEQSLITAANKAAIRLLYDTVLNQHRFDRLSELIATDYTNTAGGKGVTAFRQSLQELAAAFPDAAWLVEDLTAEGSQVMVRQQFRGTHLGTFQHIPPAGKRVAVAGVACYTFRAGKIIHSQILTDRFSFLQQLDALPAVKKEPSKAVYFIDKFFVPLAAADTFKARMQYNRDFIRSLPGFIKDEAWIAQGSGDSLVIITIAAWENEAQLQQAKQSVQAAYRRIGFDPAAFYRQSGIRMERGTYARYQ